MVKGLGCDRHGSLPSLLPSETQIFCWRGRWSDLRGSDVFKRIVNQPVFYRSHFAGDDTFATFSGISRRGERMAHSGSFERKK